MVRQGRCDSRFHHPRPANPVADKVSATSRRYLHLYTLAATGGLSPHPRPANSAASQLTMYRQLSLQLAHPAAHEQEPGHAQQQRAESDAEEAVGVAGQALDCALSSEHECARPLPSEVGHGVEHGHKAICETNMVAEAAAAAHEVTVPRAYNHMGMPPPPSRAATPRK
eukprot:scaffold23933_cov119-Isochrysis_galbana.AAC.4